MQTQNAKQESIKIAAKILQNLIRKLNIDHHDQDEDPGVQHGDGAGGVAAGLHAAGVPLPGGVRGHPETDRDLQEVSQRHGSDEEEEM